MNKICNKCYIEKPLTAFHEHARMADGHSKYCKACAAKHLKRTLASAKAAQDKYCKANAKKKAAGCERWRTENPEKYKAAQAAYRKNNKAKIAAGNSARRKNNLAVYCARSVAYTAKKLNATPAWANEFYISEFYDLARRRTKALGIEHQVDHIVPLRGKLVCGLHVEYNLRVIPAPINASKGNRHWPDMPDLRM